MRHARIAAALATVAIGWAGCQQAPAAASPGTTGRQVGTAAALAAPHDIACTRNGTLWTCRHGAAGDVVAQLQDYATRETESDCTWDYRPGPAGHTADGRWFLVGAD